MKIALVGSAPSSTKMAPFADPSWLIWGCSPGVYPHATRVNAWFELHRWEPPTIGRPESQKPWFSPEYVMWMGQQKLVWMIDKVPEIPNSIPLPVDTLLNKYGHYFFTSSLSWMLAVAIETILQGRALRKRVTSGEVPLPAGMTMDDVIREQDVIGLWGVDMAASEEYGYQRAGCQFFLQIASKLGIEYVLPFESDLMVPPPLYGIAENDHRHIKMLARRSEFLQRMQAAEAARNQADRDYWYMRGALEDNVYHMNTWIHTGPALGANFAELFRAEHDAVDEIEKHVQRETERITGTAGQPKQDVIDRLMGGAEVTGQIARPKERREEQGSYRQRGGVYPTNETGGPAFLRDGETIFKP